MLRRLRYRLGDDFESNRPKPTYAYWTTPTTNEWADAATHELNYLVRILSNWSDEMASEHADPASSIGVGYWGEVDIEYNKLRIRQVTTESGTTRRDVDAAFAHGDTQIEQLRVKTVHADADTNKTDQVLPIVKALGKMVSNPSKRLDDVDVLFIHRGGGVNPASHRGAPNVTNGRRRVLLEAVKQIRDHGVEVVVAIGHANVSVLNRDASPRDLRSDDPDGRCGLDTAGTHQPAVDRHRDVIRAGASNMTG